jgi:TATA-binding protein-associated factor Taf7
MKLIITESKMMNVLETFLNKNFSNYDEICRIVVDPESLADAEIIWVYMVISEDWYYYDGLTTPNKTHRVNQLRQEVKKLVIDLFNREVSVGVYVKEC